MVYLSFTLELLAQRFFQQHFQVLRHLLGWATFISQLVLCLSLAICLVFHVPLRRKMGLLLPDTMRDMTQALEPSERPSGASMSEVTIGARESDVVICWDE